MEKMLKLSLIGAFLIGFPGVSMAVTGSQTFNVSAVVPAATGVSIVASSVNSTTNVFTTVLGTSLSFDPMTFDTTNAIFVPNHYFAISVGPSGGGGSTSVTVKYTEGNNPNNVVGGSTHGLGYKSTATFVKVVGTTETVLATHGKKLLNSLTTQESVTSAEVGAGYFRLYLGVETDPTAAGEPAGAEVFSGADKAGSYAGSLLITGTVV